MTYLNQTDKIYAQSLLELDIDKEQALDELLRVEEVFESSNELIKTMQNPTINLKNRIEILESVFQNKIDKKIYQFIKILVEKNRINRLKEIIKCYNDKYNNLKNIKSVEITSAIELNADYKQKVITALGKKFDKNIIPEWNVNPNIIGGLVFKIGDTVIDTSLKHKFENFNKIMK